MRTMQCFALAFTLLAGAAFAAPTTEYALGVQGTLEIGPEGTVRHYALDGNVDAAAAKAVEAAVATWRFRPIVRDGHPVIARTTMHLALEAIADDAGALQLKLASTRFGDDMRIKSIPAPKYPYEAGRAGLGARVILVLDVDENGKVRNAGAYQTNLGARTPNDKVAEQWRRLFERSALDAARAWTVERTAGSGGPVGPHQYIVPVEFRMVRSSADEGKQRWMATVPGPKNAEPWMKVSALRSEAVDALPNGAAIALDSDFALLSDVIGKTL